MQTTKMSDEVVAERQHELSALERAIADVAGGASEFIAISAAAGLGKTWLMHRARELARKQGLRVLSARGSELEREYPFGFVRQLFEPVLAQASHADRQVLASGASQAALDSILGPVGEEPTMVGEYSILHGLYWLTSDLASATPLAIFLDDLHWADESSLRFIAYLLPRLDGLQVLLVGTMRPDESGSVGKLLKVITTDTACQFMQLGPLSGASSTTLLRGLFPTEPEAAFAAACHDAAGGNPLLLVELARGALVQGLGPTAENVDQVMRIGTRAAARRVSWQLDQLPERQVRLVEAISVLAPHADLAMAAHLAAFSIEEVVGAAAHLEASQLLIRGEEVSGRTVFGFVHALVQAAVYEQMDAGRRIAYHTDAVDYLAGIGAAPEQIAAHLLRMPPRANAHHVEYLRQGASRAIARGAPEAALTLLRRALQEPPTADDRLAVVNEAGLAASRVDLPAAVDYLTQALLGEQDPSGRAVVAARLAIMLIFVDRVDEAVAVLTDAIDGLPAGDMSFKRVLEGTRLLVPVLVAGSTGHLDRIDELRRLPTQESFGARLLDGMIAVVATYQGDPEVAARCTTAATDVELIHSAGLGNPLVSAISGALAYSAPVESIHVCDAIVTEARRYGSMTALLPALAYRGLGYLLSGELSAAEDDLRGALGLIRVIGSSIGPPVIYGLLAETLLERGAVAEADSVLRFAPLQPPLPRTTSLFYPLQASARVLRAQGRNEEALRAALASGARFAQHAGGRNPAVVAWRSEAALCLHALGRLQEAQEFASEEVALARKWGAPFALGRALRVHGTISSGQAGMALLGEAVDVLAPSTARLEHAKAAIALGSALRRGNSKSEARSYLAEGLELANRCGATVLVDHALTELRVSGSRPRRLTTSGPEALTVSERRVADLAAQDLTNREIAQHLFVTVKTVEVHLSATYRKLGIAERKKLKLALKGGQSPSRVEASR